MVFTNEDYDKVLYIAFQIKMNKYINRTSSNSTKRKQLESTFQFTDKTFKTQEKLKQALKEYWEEF